MKANFEIQNNLKLLQDQSKSRHLGLPAPAIKKRVYKYDKKEVPAWLIEKQNKIKEVANKI